MTNPEQVNAIFITFLYIAQLKVSSQAKYYTTEWKVDQNNLFLK